MGTRTGQDAAEMTDADLAQAIRDAEQAVNDAEDWLRILKEERGEREEDNA